MRAEWIAVELISILVENIICLYFLNSRYQSKRNCIWPQLATWALLVFSGIINTVSSVTIIGFIAYAIMLVYLIIFKNGTILQKAFGVLVVCSIEIATSIMGGAWASFMDSAAIDQTAEYQDTSRLFAILLTKMIQVVVFYILAKRHEKSRNLQRRPAVVLCVAAILDFIYLFTIHKYIYSPDLQIQQHRLLVWLAIGALLVIIAIFVIYELFIREEIKNVKLAMELQRIALEAGFFSEIDQIYTELRTWQHDYKNNLNALRTLVYQAQTEKALEYIDNMNNEVYKNKIMLQTGNLVLDAIVSSKLWLAQTKNIEFSIQAVYPENNHISDNDLCAIVGNLIDNAIEACARMDNTSKNKFIDFSLILKGKNLLISISNSYNNELKLKGNRFLTVKNEPYHGIGILHIDSIVRKYQGHVLRSQENGVFETNIMIPLLYLEEVSYE